MKPAATRFPVKTGAALGFLAMAVVGWNLGGTPAPAEKTAAAPENLRSGCEARRPRSTGPDAAARQRLSAIRAAGSPQARHAATLALAHSLSPAEIENWLGGGWFDVKGGPERLIFRNYLLARLAETDPEAALAYSLRNGIRPDPIMMASLADKEPERLIEYFKKHPDKSAEMEALKSIAARHPTVALQRLQEMVDAGLHLDGPGDKAFKVLLQAAAASPAAFEAAIASLPLSMRKAAETALCEQKLITGFRAEMLALWDRPGGWNTFQSILRENQELRRSLLTELPNLPPMWRADIADNSWNLIRRGDTGKWLDADLEASGFSPGQAAKIRKNALELMIWYDAEKACARVNDMEMDPGQRQTLMRRIYQSLGKDPEKAEAVIARISDPQERELARQAAASGNASYLARTGGVSELKTADPVQWMERMSAADPRKPSDYSAYLSQMQQWGPERQTELSEQFAALPDSGKGHLARLLVGNGASATPIAGDAIRYLIDHPEALPQGTADKKYGDPVYLASDYATRLAYRNPAAATDWVATLPTGDARLWAQKNVARNWSVYDPQAAGQWVATLPPNARREVQAFMEGGK